MKKKNKKRLIVSPSIYVYVYIFTYTGEFYRIFKIFFYVIALPFVTFTPTPGV